MAALISPAAFRTKHWKTPESPGLTALMCRAPVLSTIYLPKQQHLDFLSDQRKLGRPSIHCGTDAKLKLTVFSIVHKLGFTSCFVNGHLLHNFRVAILNLHVYIFVNQGHLSAKIDWVINISTMVLISWVCPFPLLTDWDARCWCWRHFGTTGWLASGSREPDKESQYRSHSPGSARLEVE